MSALVDEQNLDLPPKPEEPLASDCCGNGCSPCVVDIYQEELAIWETECARIKNGSGMINADEHFCQPEILKLEKDLYHGFSIASILQETKDTLRVRFKLHPAQSLGLSVGQHIVIRATNSNGSIVTRQYTPVSPVPTKGYFEFLLKVYPLGQMSQIIPSWQVGDKVEMRGPLGSLSYMPNKHPRVLMLCAGTGIAPMCQVIHGILDNEEDETMIRLAYACKSYPEVLAKPELSEWRRYWNFSSVFILSQEPDHPDYTYGYGEEIIKGRMDETFVRQQLADRLDETLVLICGTRPFDADMLTFTRKLGISEKDLHKF